MTIAILYSKSNKKHRLLFHEGNKKWKYSVPSKKLDFNTNVYNKLHIKYIIQNQILSTTS